MVLEIREWQQLKNSVFEKVDIDMIAGPSEILIIADDKADAKYVAADFNVASRTMIN